MSQHTEQSVIYSWKRALWAAMFALVGFGVYHWLHTSSRQISGAQASRRSPSVAPDNQSPRLGFAGSPNPSGAGVDADGCSANAQMDIGPDDAGFDKTIAARIRSAMEQWQSALISSADIRQQAVGLALRSSAATSVQHTDNKVALDMLANLAGTTTDPVVYALALRVCGRQSGNSSGGYCDAISPEGWAQIDPDNAAAWLDVARDLEQRPELGGAAEALRNAAAAHRYDSGTDSLVAIALPAMPAGHTLFEQYFLTADLTGFQAAMAVPSWLTAMRCTDIERGSPNVLKDCSAIAETLVATGKGTTDLAIGARLGEKVGWSAQRVKDLRRQEEALMMVMMGGARDFSVPQSCHDAVRDVEKLKRRSAIGEIPALREELQSSGQSVDDLADEYEQSNSATRAKAKALSKATGS